MSTIQRLSAEQRDDLVAYLDGELEEASSQEIEKILAKNPVARNDVEMLMRTWELLDALPRAEATEEFTQKTLSSIQAVDARDPVTEKPWFQKLKRGVMAAGWTAGIALSAVLGFAITNRVIPSESRLLVENLPVVERLDIYREVDNIEFLRELRRSGLFNERVETNDR